MIHWFYSNHKTVLQFQDTDDHFKHLTSLAVFCKGRSWDGGPLIGSVSCLAAAPQAHWGSTLWFSLLCGVFGSHRKGLDQDGPQEHLGWCPLSLTSPGISLTLSEDVEARGCWDYTGLCLCRRREHSGLAGARSPAGHLETSAKRGPDGPGYSSMFLVFFGPFGFSVWGWPQNC